MEIKTSDMGREIPIRMILMIKSEMVVINDEGIDIKVEVGAGVLIDTNKMMKKIEEERGRGNTVAIEEGMNGRKGSVDTGLGVLNPHRQSLCHHAQCLESAPNVNTVETGIVTNEEDTKVVAEKIRRSHHLSVDIVQGGSDQRLFHHHPLHRLNLWMTP